MGALGAGVGRFIAPLMRMVVDVPPDVFHDMPKGTCPVALDISLLVILALVVHVSE